MHMSKRDESARERVDHGPEHQRRTGDDAENRREYCTRRVSRRYTGLPIEMSIARGACRGVLRFPGIAVSNARGDRRGVMAMGTKGP